MVTLNFTRWRALIKTFHLVRGEDNKLLYHRVLHEPIRTDTEVFSNDPNQSLTRIPLDNPQGVSQFLVGICEPGHWEEFVTWNKRARRDHRARATL